MWLAQVAWHARQRGKGLTGQSNREPCCQNHRGLTCHSQCSTQCNFRRHCLFPQPYCRSNYSMRKRHVSKFLGCGKPICYCLIPFRKALHLMTVLWNSASTVFAHWESKSPHGGLLASPVHLVALPHPQRVLARP